MDSYKIKNPVGFDPIAVLPPDLHRWADEARYLVHLIRRRQKKKKTRPTEGTPLYSPYLQKTISIEYAKIRKALIAGGIIECNEHYQRKTQTKPGICKKYRIAPAWAKVKWEIYSLTGKTICRRLNRNWVPKDPIHKHLYEKLGQIEIDLSGAEKYIQEIIQQKPETRCYLEAMVNKVANKCFRLTVDSAGRLHHNIVGMKRGLRKFLKHPDGPLVSLDVVNSQPLIFSLLLANQHLNKRLTLDIKLPKNFRDLLPSDAREYIELCERGELYNSFSANSSRAKTKKDLLSLFFGERRREDFDKPFGRRFPTVLESMWEFKRRDYKYLPRLCQRVESDIMIKGVAGRIMKECHGAFIATLHDCLMTTERHAARFEEIIREEFANCGLSLTIKREVYQ